MVLVTGASQGIGSEVAIFYARAGATLSLVARSQAKLNETKTLISKEIPSAPSQVVTFVADVRNLDQVKAAVEGTAAKFGKLDIVVANAGKGDVFDYRESRLLFRIHHH